MYKLANKWSERHQSIALSIHNKIITIFGMLSGLCILGGIVAILWNAVSKTEFSMFGVTLSTGHVGVAFVGIGLVTAYFAVKAVLKSQYELAALLPDKNDGVNFDKD
jgi:hypothetical protein